MQLGRARPLRKLLQFFPVFRGFSFLTLEAGIQDAAGKLRKLPSFLPFVPEARSFLPGAGPAAQTLMRQVKVIHN